MTHAKFVTKSVCFHLLHAWQYIWISHIFLKGDGRTQDSEHPESGSHSSMHGPICVKPTRRPGLLASTDPRVAVHTFDIVVCWRGNHTDEIFR